MMHLRALGVSVTPVLVDDIVEAASQAISDNRTLIIAAHNLHSVYVFHSDAAFREFYNRADLVAIDGWPILALANRQRLREGSARLPGTYRLGSTDWLMDAFARSGATRICAIGASSDSNSRFIHRAADANPSLRFMGIPADPWDPKAIDLVAEQIVEFRPEMTVIGMGMPLQESVTRLLLDRGLTGVVATVGGAIDQISGAQAHAPRWTGRYGVEWVWRLATDPKRLAHRYLVEPFQLARLLSSRRGAS